MLIKRVLQLWEKITITNEAFIDGGVNIMRLEKAWNCDGLTKNWTITKEVADRFVLHR